MSSSVPIVKKSCDSELPVNSAPLVSIITSCLNDAKGLEVTLNAIAKGSYKNIEYIVIDGGSTDGTIDVISSHLSLVTKYISERDEGIYDAWNKGIKLATGQYISFLGAGDYYTEDGLRQLVDCAIANPEADFISGKCEIMANGKSVRIVGSAWNWKVFRRYMNTMHVGWLHSRRLFDRYGEFDTSFRIAGDYEFLLRAGNELKAAFLDRVVVKMAAGGVSQRGYQVIMETERAKLKHHTVPAIVARLDTAVAFAKRFLRNRFLA